MALGSSPAMVVPFELPMPGLPLRSASVGTRVFGCFELMMSLIPEGFVSPSTAAGKSTFRQKKRPGALRRRGVEDEAERPR
jgi:hypothetical protein